MVDNQHKKIVGYRDLTDEEIGMMNAAKTQAEAVGALIKTFEVVPGVDKRWLSIAKTDLQKGFMALVRAVARPETFVLAVVVLWWQPSYAQQPAPPEKNYNLALTLPEIQTIANALQERPYKEVATLLGKMQQQVAAQSQPPAPPVPPKE